MFSIRQPPMGNLHNQHQPILTPQVSRRAGSLRQAAAAVAVVSTAQTGRQWPLSRPTLHRVPYAPTSTHQASPHSLPLVSLRNIQL